MPKRITFLLALLLPLSSVNAALLGFDNRDQWLLAVDSGSPDLSEDFDSFSSDQVYGLGEVRAGFLNLKTVGNSSRELRIEVPNNSSTRFFPVNPNSNGPNNNAYPFVTLATFGNSRSELEFIKPGAPNKVANPLRAIGFEYKIANLPNSKPGSVETNLGDSVAVDADKSFLGLFYDNGEQFTSLTLRALGSLGISVDNIEAFGAPLEDQGMNPVPLPAAFWLFASALLALFGFKRARPGFRR